MKIPIPLLILVLLLTLGAVAGGIVLTQQRVQSGQAALDLARSEGAGLLQQIADLEAESAVLEGEISEIEAHIESQQEQIEGAEERIAGRSAEIEELRERLNAELCEPGANPTIDYRDNNTALESLRELLNRTEGTTASGSYERFYGGDHITALHRVYMNGGEVRLFIVFFAGSPYRDGVYDLNRQCVLAGDIR